MPNISDRLEEIAESLEGYKLSEKVLIELLQNNPIKAVCCGMKFPSWKDRKIRRAFTKSASTPGSSLKYILSETESDMRIDDMKRANIEVHSIPENRIDMTSYPKSYKQYWSEFLVSSNGLIYLQPHEPEPQEITDHKHIGFIIRTNSHVKRAITEKCYKEAINAYTEILNGGTAKHNFIEQIVNESFIRINKEVITELFLNKWILVINGRLQKVFNDYDSLYDYITWTKTDIVLRYADKLCWEVTNGATYSSPM